MLEKTAGLTPEELEKFEADLSDPLRRGVRDALLHHLRRRTPQFISATDAATTARIVNYLLDWGALDGLAARLAVPISDTVIGCHGAGNADGERAETPVTIDQDVGSTGRDCGNYRTLRRACE